MEFAIGFTVAAMIFCPMFVMVWQEDEPIDEEDAKTLMGALD